MDLTATERRLLWIGLALSGIVHLLVPERLLSMAQQGYQRGLAVEFTPQDGARHRVRLLGVAFLGLSAVLRQIFD